MLHVHAPPPFPAPSEARPGPKASRLAQYHYLTLFSARFGCFWTFWVELDHVLLQPQPETLLSAQFLLLLRQDLDIPLYLSLIGSHLTLDWPIFDLEVLNCACMHNFDYPTQFWLQFSVKWPLNFYSTNL